MSTYRRRAAAGPSFSTQKLAFNPDFPIELFEYSIPFELKSLHIHDCIELGYIIEGSGDFFIEKKRYSFQPGDIFLINRYEAHRARSSSREKAKAFFIYISLEFLEQVTFFIPQKRLMTLSALSGQGFDNLLTAGALKQAMREIRDEFRDHEIYRLEILRSSVARLLFLVMRSLQSTMHESVSFQVDTHRDALLKVLEHVQRHIGAHHSISELATMANMSDSNFRKVFKQYTGRSPLSWITSRKLKLAYVLIMTRGLTALDASLEAGFDSYSSFSKQFKLEFGMSPSQVQKSAKEAAVDPLDRKASP